MGENENKVEKVVTEATKLRIEYHLGRAAGRMANGWKISLALWSALALILGSLLTSWELLVRGFWPLWWMFGVLLLVVATYVYWAVIIGMHNRADREQTYKLFEEFGIKDPCYKGGKFLHTWYSQIFQIVITVALVVLILFALIGKRHVTGNEPRGTCVGRPHAHHRCETSSGEQRWKKHWE